MVVGNSIARVTSATDFEYINLQNSLVARPPVDVTYHMKYIWQSVDCPDQFMAYFELKRWGWNLADRDERSSYSTTPLPLSPTPHTLMFFALTAMY